MRTIYFSDEDIKECKLALLRQNLNSLQSAFLTQYIVSLETKVDRVTEKIRFMLANFKQDEHIGSATDDDVLYDDLLDILEDKEVK